MTFDFTQLTAQSRYLVDKTFYIELSEDALIFWHHRPAQKFTSFVFYQPTRYVLKCCVSLKIHIWAVNQ